MPLSKHSTGVFGAASAPRPARRAFTRPVWVAALAVGALVAALVSVITFPADGYAEAAAVTEQGVVLQFGGITVEGPAGVAPLGTVLTARDVGLPPVADELPGAFGQAGRGISLDLGGRQPLLPLRITFPTAMDYVSGPDDMTASVLTRPSDGSRPHLVPAVYDPQRRTVTAEVTHLSDFWEWGWSAQQFANDVLESLLGASPRPDCHGRPLQGVAGTTELLVPPGDPAWACLYDVGNGVALELTNNSPTAWYTEAAPRARLDQARSVGLADSVAVALARRLYAGRDNTPGIMVVGGAVTYRFDREARPAAISLEADPGAFLVSALVFASETAATAFGLDLLSTATELDRLAGCIVGALEVAPVDSLDAAGVAAFLRAGFGCFDLGPVLGLLAGGAGLLASGLVGIAATVAGPKRIEIVGGAHAADPCASPSDFIRAVEVAEPGRFGADGWFERVESVQCLSGHALAMGVPRREAVGHSQLVLSPVAGGGWTLSEFDIGLGCRDTGLPLPVERVVCPNGPVATSGRESSGVEEMLERWQELYAACRGGHGDEQATIDACAQRDELSPEIAEGTGRAFIEAWRADDITGMRRLADNQSVVGQAQVYRPVAGPVTCLLHGSGYQYQCDVDAVDGQRLYVLLEEADAGRWSVVWVSIAHD